MAGPPDNVEAAELWRRLSEHPRPSEVVDFPRRDGEGKPIAKIRLQVLTLEQHDEARFRAQKWLKEDRKIKNEDLATEIGEAIAGDATACELLALSCVSVKPIAGTSEEFPRYARLFVGGQDLREKLAADEIATLFTQYLMVQRAFGPTGRMILTDEDLNSWILRLSTGAGSYPLAPLDSLQLAELTTSLAGRIFSLSRKLESQLSSLPPTLVSDLKSLGIGTGFFGSEPDTASETGGEKSADARLIDAKPGESIDIEAASEVSRKIRGS